MTSIQQSRTCPLNSLFPKKEGRHDQDNTSTTQPDRTRATLARFAVGGVAGYIPHSTYVDADRRQGQARTSSLHQPLVADSALCHSARHDHRTYPLREKYL